MQLKRYIAIPLLGLLGACFTEVPVTPAVPQPQPGSQVTLELNDMGRTALGPTMGPDISQIDGRLVNHDSSQYVVAVNEVHYEHGDAQPWAGAETRVQSDYVTYYSTRRFSLGRTVALGAVVAAADVLLVSQLRGSSTSDNSPNTGGNNPPPIQRVGPILRIPLKPAQTIRVIQRLVPYLLKH